MEQRMPAMRSAVVRQCGLEKGDEYLSSRKKVLYLKDQKITFGATRMQLRAQLISNIQKISNYLLLFVVRLFLCFLLQFAVLTNNNVAQDGNTLQLQLRASVYKINVDDGEYESLESARAFSDRKYYDETIACQLGFF